MKHWVFDLDGTLVDSLAVHFQVLEKVFSHFKVPFTRDHHQEVLKISARTLPEYFESRLGKSNAVVALDLFRQLTNEALNSIKPFGGIENLLKTLKNQDRKLAVWTARDLAATTKILEVTGLASYFSICVSGTCTAHGKPHPEGLQKIAEHFGTDSSTMIMIGDFDSDMLGAQAFGTKAVRVLWHSSVEKKKCEIATWQFEKVEQFQMWVDQIA